MNHRLTDLKKKVGDVIKEERKKGSWREETEERKREGEDRNRQEDGKGKGRREDRGIEGKLWKDNRLAKKDDKSKEQEKLEKREGNK